MDELSIKANPREGTGKGPSRRLRADGALPAILYGTNVKESIKLSLNARELDKLLNAAHSAHPIVSVDIEGAKKPRNVIFKEIVRHPVHEKVLHVDLQEISLDQEITVGVPLHVVGKSVGVVEGGVLQQDMREINVTCLPTNVPDALEIDITEVVIGHSLHVKDISLPDGVKVVDDEEMAIVSVLMPRVIEEAKTAEEIEAELSESFEEKGEGEGEEKEAPKKGSSD